MDASLDTFLDAIDLAYQAALEPGLWARALVAVADSLQASRALILCEFEGGSQPAIMASEADEPLADTYFAEFRGINPIQEALNRRGGKGPPPVYCDQDLVAKSELLRTEFYECFMRPADMHGILLLPVGEHPVATVNLFRGRRAPDFEGAEIERARRMQRSISGAWAVRQRLGEQRAIDEALGDFVDRLPSAVLLVVADGRIAHANASARAIIALNDGVGAPAKILEASAPGARPQLKRLIAQATASDAEHRRAGAMAAPRLSGKLAFAIQVTPARGEPALAAYHAPLALVCISDPQVQPRLETRRLQEVFGLSAAESRLAIALFEGASLRQIANQTGVSFETVRNQLRAVFEKTGVNRQSALVGLLTRAIFAQLE